MQSNHQFSPQNPFFSREDQARGAHIFNIAAPSVCGQMTLPAGFKPSMPFHGIEFQSSEACPKNFIICDRTDYRSQIMFHPAMTSKFPYPDLNFNATYFQDNMDRVVANKENTEVISCLKEDSDDINALLSLEEEEHEEYDDEEVSTARTTNCGSSSPESYSNYDCQSRKSRTASSMKSSGNSSNCGERKRRKLRKMVKALKGIVPGTSRMSTVTVLDEAVRYLKSLKVEVQKLGVESLKTFS